MKKCSSHGKKGTAISVSKSPQQKSSICRYTLEDPGNEKSRSKSRFAGSLLDARAVPILPMVSCAGEKMAVVFGRFWKDPIHRKRKRRQCL